MAVSEIGLRVEDRELLEVLEVATDEELSPLVRYIADIGNVSCELINTEKYKLCYPLHHKYYREIAAEIQKFGGNTFANIARGGKGVLYREIVCDVADRLKVEYDKDQPIDIIETLIAMKFLEKAWDEMTPEEKRKLLDELSDKFKSKDIPDSFPFFLFQELILLGGFKSYQVALKITLNVANTIARILLGEGLKLAANSVIAATTTKLLSILTGPIGWVLTGLWTVLDIAGPAYRVTVPCVVHVGAIRQIAFQDGRLKRHSID